MKVPKNYRDKMNKTYDNKRQLKHNEFKSTNELRHENTCLMQMRKTKAQISCACAQADQRPFVVHCYLDSMSRVVRKKAFCICENKDADQLRGNREADQRLCFRYSDSTIPLLPASEISSL